MRKIRVTLRNPTNERTEQVELPTHLEEIDDAMARCDIWEEYSMYDCRFSNGNRFLRDEVLAEENIYELNFLATLLHPMDALDVYAVCGGVSIYREVEKLKLKDVINLTLNVQELENIECYPARNDEELGEYLIENDMIPIEKTMETNKTWLLEHLDLKKIGREYRDHVIGKYEGIGFVTMGGQRQELYDGIYRMPLAPDYVFEVKVRGEESDKVLYMKLPITEENFQERLAELEQDADVSFRIDIVNTTIKQIENITYDPYDFDEINQLANGLADLRSEGKIRQFKALFSISSADTVKDIMQLISEASNFKLQPIVQTREGSGLKDKNQVIVTEYGALISNTTTIEGVQEEQNIELSM